MIQMSTRFAEYVGTSHAISTKFEIWQPGGLSAIYQSINDYAGCAIVDGSVTFTKDSDQRGQFTMTIVSPNLSLIPQSNTDPLTPWGNEMRIWTGITYPDGTTEWCPMGCYRMNSVQVHEQNGAPTIVVTGYDRSYYISRNVVQVYWPTAQILQNMFNLPQVSLPGGGSGVLWPYIIQLALSSQWPYAQFDNTPAVWVTQMNDQTNSIMTLPASGATNSSFAAGTDLYDQMRQYARAAGCDLWADRNGVFTFRQDPVLTFFTAGYIPVPVVSFVEGPSAQFDQLQRNMSDQSAYNRVIVTGNGQIVGVSPTLTSYPLAVGGVNSNGVFADDDDPNSPTYIGIVDRNPNSPTFAQVTGPSKYGVVTHQVSNNLLTSAKQVNNFAMLTLALDVGTQESITLNSMLTDPRIEIDDVIMATRQRDGINDIFYIVSGLTIPLTNKSAMQLTVREKRNLSFGAGGLVSQQ